MVVSAFAPLELARTVRFVFDAEVFLAGIALAMIDSVICLK
jgi:hypothetical protein